MTKKQEISDLKAKILERGNIPRHVAIIMDGNGRWAKQNGLPRIAGHKKGVNSVREIVEVCPEINVEILTLYTFSRENWFRPKQETSSLMHLLLTTIRKEINTLHKNNVRVITIGNLNDLPEGPRTGIREAIAKTDKNTGLILNLALSYSSRIEIINAVKAIALDAGKGKVRPEEITEELFEKYLDTRDIRPPDLLIRTSGVSRISNFLLWQLAYTELYFSEVHWPDFKKLEFLKAIEDYQQRERRFGRVSEQLTDVTP